MQPDVCADRVTGRAHQGRRCVTAVDDRGDGHGNTGAAAGKEQVAVLLVRKGRHRKLFSVYVTRIYYPIDRARHADCGAAGGRILVRKRGTCM